MTWAELRARQKEMRARFPARQKEARARWLRLQLEALNGNVSALAKQLQYPRNCIYTLLRDHGVDMPALRANSRRANRQSEQKELRA
jgi:DNA-binding NtrC family response regulator